MWVCNYLILKISASNTYLGIWVIYLILYNFESFKVENVLNFMLWNIVFLINQMVIFANLMSKLLQLLFKSFNGFCCLGWKQIINDLLF